MGRSSRKSELLDALTGGDSPIDEESLDNLPVEFKFLPGETAKQYRERIAPAFTEHLVARAVVRGDQKAMELVTGLMVKDMDNKIRLAQIIGPNGVKKQLIEAGADDFRELTGTGNIPSAAAGIAAGFVRPSDMAAQA